MSWAPVLAGGNLLDFSASQIFLLFETSWNLWRYFEWLQIFKIWKVHMFCQLFSEKTSGGGKATNLVLPNTAPCQKPCPEYLNLSGRLYFHLISFFFVSAVATIRCNLTWDTPILLVQQFRKSALHQFSWHWRCESHSRCHVLVSQLYIVCKVRTAWSI